MSCYELEILSRYQDGSLDEAEARRIAAHLEGCSSCREKLRTLGHAGLFFRIALGGRKSAECISDEQLGAYLSGQMSREDRRRVEDHLNSCRKCLHEVAQLSDAATLAPATDSPVPDARALARFRRLAPRASSRRPVLAFFATWAPRAAAAALLLAAAFGWMQSVPTIGPDAVVAASGEPRQVGGYVTDVSLSPESLLAPTGGTEMARFAREAGVVLREIERVGEHPRTDAFELVQEDILNSELISSFSRLSEFARDDRDRKFLNDCSDILMQTVKTDSRTVECPFGDLDRIVSQIRRLDLIETARLIELEGGRSPWLAGL